MSKFSLMLSLMAVAGLSQADLRSELKAARLKQEKAAMAMDTKGVETAMKESMTSDFKYVQAGRTQDSQTFLKEYMASLVMMKKITSSSTRIISLKENGNKGSGEIELKMTGIMKSEDKKTHSINWTGVFTEEFRKVGGKWKLATMTQGAQKFLMDGKPVKM